MNQGESRTCENHEIVTLKNKILLPKEIKYYVHHSKVRLFSFTAICIFCIIGGLCQLLLTVKGTPINGPLWVHVLVDLPITALLAPPNELQHCYSKPDLLRLRLRQSQAQRQKHIMILKRFLQQRCLPYGILTESMKVNHQRQNK